VTETEYDFPQDITWQADPWIRGLAVQARTGDGIETRESDGSTIIRDPGSAAFDQVYYG